MEKIRDVLYIKSLEKHLGRPLTNDDLYEDEFRIEFPDGRIEFYEIPMLVFPYDLLTKPEDLYVSELESLASVA